MIERETGSRWDDPYVQSAVDLSAINWLCTANSLEGLPTPLLDRLRILRMPSPTAEHLPALAASLLRELARERGIDPRWLPPLASYEIEGLQNAWTSGSIRGLRRLLEGVLEARDQAAPRN
jgi:ATP-dependent Lon protease